MASESDPLRAVALEGQRGARSHDPPARARKTQSASASSPRPSPFHLSSLRAGCTLADLWDILGDPKHPEPLSDTQKDAAFARLLRHARAGELWFLKQQPEPAVKPSKGKGAPKTSTEEDLARDEENALTRLALSVSDACLRCVRALDPPPDPNPCPASALKKQHLLLEPSNTRQHLFAFQRHVFARREGAHFSVSFARPARSRSSLTSPTVLDHRRSRAEAESRVPPLTLVAPLPVRNVAYGLGDAASWESTWQQHKFVLELAGKHASRDSASRGAALSKLKNLCEAEGYPAIDSAKAHNVVNCMVAAGLLGKREAYVTDERGRGVSTSVVYLARFAPADAAAAAAAAGETRMVSDGELPILAEALREALEGEEATEGLMTDGQLMRVLVRTLQDGSGAFQWSAQDTSVKSKVNKLFARVREWLVERGFVECTKAHATVTDEKTRKTTRKTMDALRLTLATLPAVEAAQSPTRLGAPEAEDALDGDDQARSSAPLLKPVGGKSMQLETRVEDSLVSLCAAAGEDGVCVPDIARAFGFAVKPFGKRAADMYERNQLAFGVKAGVKREGKSSNTYMYRNEYAPKEGGAGASAGAMAKKRARRAGSRRGAPPRVPVPQVYRPVAQGRGGAPPAGAGPERGRPQRGRVRPEDRRTDRGSARPKRGPSPGDGVQASE